MELSLKADTLTLTSEKREILLNAQGLTLDALFIDTPWEYEKWGFLCYVRQAEEWLIYQFQVEGMMGAFICEEKIELSSGLLDFLSDVDVLFVLGSRELRPAIEKIDPRILVIFWENGRDLASTFSVTDAVSQCKMKASDFLPDTMSCILMEHDGK